MAANPNSEAFRAAVVDGRAHNVFYRIDQLTRLHARLVKDPQSIIRAIAAYSEVHHDEAQFEFVSVAETLKKQIGMLDPKKELEDEYLPAQGRDHGLRRVPVGAVVIIPSPHTPFYSTMAPLSSAIAAGNCAVIQLTEFDERITSIISQIINDSLDGEAFMLTLQPVQDRNLIQNGLHITPMYFGPSLSYREDSLPTDLPLAIAVVDRSADIDKAAAAIIQARLSYNGRSLYAPDIVLVNEFVKKELLHSLVKHTISVGSVNIPNNEKTGAELQETITNFQTDTNADIVTKNSRGAVLEIKSRGANAFWSTKRRGPIVVVHSIRSLDDGIDLVTKAIPSHLLALYTFGKRLDVSKYLCQFVIAQASFVNQIPVELLWPAVRGPSAFEPLDRYPLTDLTKPAPIFVRDLSVKENFTLGPGKKSSELRSKLAAALLPVPPPRPTAKQMTASFGFFEQAFVLNMALRAVFLCGIVAGVIWWYRVLPLGR